MRLNDLVVAAVVVVTATKLLDVYYVRAIISNILHVLFKRYSIIPITENKIKA